MTPESAAVPTTLDTSDLAVVAVFALTYLGVAIGRVPGLRIDRAGIAVVGATAMMAIRRDTIADVAAKAPWDTIALLLGMMIVIAQLRHARIVHRIASLVLDRTTSRIPLMILAAGLSAILTNDVACLAIAPILCKTLPRRGIDPVPWLLALAIAANLGSATTVIGNPQNILVAERTHLDFLGYLLFAIVPVIVALIAAQLILHRLEPGTRMLPADDPILGIAASDIEQDTQIRRGEGIFGLIVLAAVLGLFVTDIPRGPIALGAAAVLLLNPSISTRKLLRKVDWSLLLLVAGLGIVVEDLRETGLPQRVFDATISSGVDPLSPIPIITLTATASTLVSNVPAILLLLGSIPEATAETGTLLALASTFAGNLIVVGSLANIIVVTVARRHDIEITVGRHARIGIPVTIVSLVVLMLWA
jgi:Na+/H+ antiporter NhaD/arsenite permease-like protein